MAGQGDFAARSQSVPQGARRCECGNNIRHPKATMLPSIELRPPFQLTRASHVSLTVTDLGASRDFYRDVIGLVLTEETADKVYFRGLEEAVHHSLTLTR